MFVPEAARFGRLLELAEGVDLGQDLNDAMAVIEQANSYSEDPFDVLGAFD